MAKKKTKKVKEPSTPKPQGLKKKSHVLLQDVAFSEGIKRKGQRVYLTEEGRKYFKSLNFIK